MRRPEGSARMLPKSQPTSLSPLSPPRPFIIPVPFSRPLSNPRSPQKVSYILGTLCTPSQLHTPQRLVPPTTAGLGAVGNPPPRYNAGLSPAPGTGTSWGPQLLFIWRSSGPWISRGAWLCCRTCRCWSSAGVMGLLWTLPSCTMWGHVPHTSYIGASSSGFPSSSSHKH